MSRLLALDQSSRITGYAIFENAKLIHYGKFTIDNDDFGERLLKIRKKVSELINQYEIDELVFEDIQLQNNVQNNVDTFKKLAEVFGIIYELVTERKIPHDIVLASSWKSSLGIKGRERAEQKKNAQLWVSTQYGVSPTQDECDAICIGVYASKKAVTTQSFDWSE